jgi:hypothetical protein
VGGVAAVIAKSTFLETLDQRRGPRACVVHFKLYPGYFGNKICHHLGTRVAANETVQPANRA